MSVLWNEAPAVATGPRRTITATVSIEGIPAPINFTLRKERDEDLTTFLYRVAQRCEWLGNEMDRKPEARQ